jgi:prepilin-type N-terminal cleavage/methylation domain-containing protein
MLKKVKKTASGFTLVEVVISLLIVAVAAAGLIKSLISIEYTAESVFRESSALNVALSTLEQIKSTTNDGLDESIITETFNLRTGNGEIKALHLGTANELSVPIVTDGENQKSLPLVLSPSIEYIGETTAVWIRVEYQYEHPKNGPLTNVIGCIRSPVQSF